MSLRLDELGNSVTEPFRSIAEVLQWAPGQFLVPTLSQAQNKVSTNILLDSSVSKKLKAQPILPQLLVCHDMRGGYLEDRFSNGCSQSSAYKLYHWQFIDIFIYFSHEFVTIPPIGWIKAAKKHGVTVLGTVITEWNDGAIICKQLLESDELMDRFTTKLAQLSLFHGFDGWLVNIENKVESEQVPQLQKFVQQLRDKCRHLLGSSSKVLWYDSVISSGELIWQNELNSLNNMFFTVSDGIFLNYCITDEHLSRSRQAAAALGREADVFVGVDVFGRGTPGGGGFNTIETVKMIQSHGLSCALFAPGWVYEHLGQEQFDSHEIMYWGILSEALAPRPVQVPFSTSFCRGYGDCYYVHGKVLIDSPWYNLSLQQVQPSFTQSQFVSYTVCKLLLQRDEPESQQEKLRDESESQQENQRDETESQQEKQRDESESQQEKQRDESESQQEKQRNESESQQENQRNETEIQQENQRDETEIQQENQRDEVESQQEKQKETFIVEVETQETNSAHPKMMFDTKVGYFGGGSLRITASRLEAQPVLFRIFVLQAPAEGHLHISTTVQVSKGSDCLCGVAVSTGSPGEGSTVVCTDTDLGDRHRQMLQNMLAQSDCTSASDCLSTSVCFVTGLRVESVLSNDGEWITSTYSIDTSCLSESGDQSQEFILSAILVPFLDTESKDRTSKLMCAHIGHLQVLGTPNQNPQQENFSIGNFKCLEVKVDTHLTKENVNNILMHPCLCPKEVHSAQICGSPHQLMEARQLKMLDVAVTDQQINNILDKRTVSTDSRTALAGVRHMVDLTSVSSDLTVDASAGTRYTLYVLKWVALQEDVVYLVYCYDEVGEKNFIGQTVESWFVWKQVCQGRELARFSVQPIILLPHIVGEEVLFCV